MSLSEGPLPKKGKRRRDREEEGKKESGERVKWVKYECAEFVKKITGGREDEVS